MLGCCILPHSASLWGRGTIAPRDGGGGTSGARSGHTSDRGTAAADPSACRGRKHVPCPKAIVWWIWWSIMARRSPRPRVSLASGARALTSGCRASARADAGRSRTGAGLASREHSGQHPCAHPPVLDAATGPTTPLGLTSNSALQQWTPTAELHPNVCGRCGFVTRALGSQSCCCAGFKTESSSDFLFSGSALCRGPAARDSAVGVRATE